MDPVEEHADCAVLFVIGDGLDHQAKNIGFDFFPIQVASLQQIGPRDTAEFWNNIIANKQATVHIRKGARPARDASEPTVYMLCVHRAKELTDDMVGIFRTIVARCQTFMRETLGEGEGGILGARLPIGRIGIANLQKR